MILIKNIFPCFFLALLLAACKGRNAELTIETEKNMDSIPSGSGLIIEGQTAYIVGDDGTGIYQLDTKTYRQRKILIKGLSFDTYRESKETKHDFESATLAEWNGRKYLLAFGSGSGPVARDSLLLLSTTDHRDQKILSLHEFYKTLQSLTATDSIQWNIEGATAAGNQLLILNRGNNQIMTCDSKQFFAYLFHSGSLFPKIHFSQIHLPFIDDHEARLSGACAIDEEHILLCASVEDTPDWISDGPVLGSYLAVYSLKDQKLLSSFLLKDEQGRPLKQKIESLDILQQDSEKELLLLAVSDNDDGTSKLFRLRLSF